MKKNTLYYHQYDQHLTKIISIYNLYSVPNLNHHSKYFIRRHIQYCLLLTKGLNMSWEHGGANHASKFDFINVCWIFHQCLLNISFSINHLSVSCWRLHWFDTKSYYPSFAWFLKTSPKPWGTMFFLSKHSKKLHQRCFYTMFQPLALKTYESKILLH